MDSEESDDICDLDEALLHLSPLVRRLLLPLAPLRLGALAYGGWVLAPIGTAYRANIPCSGVFGAGRAPASVISQDILADNPHCRV